MDAMQFLRGVDDPTAPYTLPHLGLNPGALRNRSAAQIIAGAQAQYADTMARAPFNISYTIESLLQSFDDLNELSAALGVPVDVLAQQLASDPFEARQAYQAQIDAQQQAARMEAERVAYEQMLADIARQESEQRARQEAYIAQTQREVAAFEAQFQAMLAEQARLEAERQAAIEAERLAAERAQYEADNAQRIALAAELQRIAASGAVPVEDMIATGQFTQEQIDLARQVQSAQLLTQQEATRLELERQEAERAAKVAVKVAQAQAAEAAAQAAEAERVRLYIEDQRAKAQAAVTNFLPGASLMTINLPADWDSYFPDDKIIWFNANQITPSQLIAAGVSAADIAWMQANGYVVRDIVAAPEVESMRPKSVDDFKSYVEGLAASDMPKRQALSSVYQYFMSNFTNGQNFTMPVLIAWLRSRPAFGDGAIIVILGKYAFDGLTNSEVFLRIAAETGLAPKSIDEVEMLMGVDVVPGAELPFVVAEETSRQIVAPEVITAPAAPSDKNASIPTTPAKWITEPVPPVTPPQPAAGAGAGLLLALASLYFLGS